MTDYEFYSKNFLAGREAVIDSASFPFWERKASKEVDKYTFGNIDKSKSIIDDVKYCVCDVAEILYKDSTIGRSDGIASEKVGDYSVTYSSQATTDVLQGKIRTAITTWLADTGLLYCGVM